MKAASPAAVLGFEQLLSGRRDEAQASFEAGLEADATDTTCLLGLLRMHVLEQDAEGTERRAQQLLALAPDHPEAKSHLAYLRLGRGEKAAFGVLQLLAEREGSGIFERLNLAKALSAQGKGDAAEAAFQRAILAEPQSPFAYLEAAEAALERGEPHRAVERLVAATRLMPSEVELWVALAEAHQAAGELTLAEAALVQACGLAPSDASLLERRFALAFDSGRFEDAIALGRRLLQLDPRSTEYPLMLGQALAHAGRPDEARPHLEEAARVDRESPGPLQALAELAYQQKQVEQAIALLEQALARAPEDIAVANDLANIYLERQQPERVEQVLGPVLKAHPAEPISSFNLALALARSDPRRAAAHARDVVESGHAQLAPEARRLLGVLSRR